MPRGKRFWPLSRAERAALVEFFESAPLKDLVKKFATYALIALAVWWAVKDPTAAARLVHSIGGAISHATASLSTIASSL